MANTKFIAASAFDGATSTTTIAAGSVNNTLVKAGPGNVYSINVSNINAAVRYCKLYDKATAPVAGTDVPVATFLIPISGSVEQSFPVGMKFDLGIGFALTTGLAAADTGAVTVSEHTVNITYA